MGHKAFDRVSSKVSDVKIVILRLNRVANNSVTSLLIVQCLGDAQSKSHSFWCHIDNAINKVINRLCLAFYLS